MGLPLGRIILVVVGAAEGGGGGAASAAIMCSGVKMCLQLFVMTAPVG